MENFNLRKFLIENKLTPNSKKLNENTPEGIYYDDRESGKVSTAGKQLVKDLISSFTDGKDSAELKGKTTEPVIPVMKRYTLEKVQPYLTKVKIKAKSEDRTPGLEQITFNGQTRLQVNMDLPSVEKGADIEASKYRALTAVQELQDVFGNLAERFKVVITTFGARVEIYLSRKWEELAQGKLNLLGEVKKVLGENGVEPYYSSYIGINKGRNGYIITAEVYSKISDEDFKILQAAMRSKFGSDFIKMPQPVREYQNIPDYTDYKILFTSEIKNTYK